MRRFVLPVLAALSLSAGFASPAAANETMTVAVKYGDLDLTSPAGRTTLETRISSAVSTVCERPDMRNLKAADLWEKCKSSAMNDAMAQMSKNLELATN